MLEDNVDKKYYLSDSMIKYISADNEKWTGNNNEALINKTYASTLNTNEGSRRCDASNYISNDVGDNYNLKIKNATKKGYLEATDGDGADISSRMEHHRGTVQKGKTQTLTTMGGENNGVVSKDLRIRKLTPKECFRLMGVKDEDFEKVKVNQSDSSLYHLAGDSIVVNVLMAIFKEMI
jgi:DNA (cytosine-5)-methyltransferase 1